MREGKDAVTAMSTAVGAGLLAHGLHVAMVLAGLWGLAALLLPHVLTRFAVAPAPVDDHAERIAALRVAVGAGGVGGAWRAPAPAEPAPVRRHDDAPLLGVPLALVATATAAGVHAAVAPPHLREGLVAGAFFLVVAGAQGAWAVAATRPTPRLLRTGVALHLALVAVWLLSRTTGLPAWTGSPEPGHAVGAWDLTCVAWQLVAAAACAATLRRGVPVRCPGWFDWHPASRAAVGAASVALVLLSVSGVAS